MKNINNKKDVELDLELENRLKCATNKSDIKRNVCKKIVDFDSKIEDNLLHINELKSDYKKLDEKMKIINAQIQTLDDANNNYYLNKEYYTNIAKYIEDEQTPVETQEKKESCDCGDKCCDNCNCNDKKLNISLDEDFAKTSREVLENLNIYNLSDLVDYFLKKY